MPRHWIIARGAYRLWRHHMAFLWEWAGIAFPIGAVYPTEFDALVGMHMGVAGTPETVRRYIAETVEKTGIIFRRRHDLRLIALRSSRPFGRPVRERGDARVPVNGSPSGDEKSHLSRSRSNLPPPPHPESRNCHVPALQRASRQISALFEAPLVHCLP